MKKFFFVSAFVTLSAMILFSCAKNSTAPLPENQAVAKLVASENFVNFSTNFIPDFISLMKYHRAIKVQNLQTVFLDQVKNSGNDETKLAEAYRQVSLDYNTALLLKNKLDNDLLTLLNKHPFLQTMEENQVRDIMLKAMEAGINSNDPRWQEAKEVINAKLNNPLMNNPALKAVATNSVVKSVNMANPGLTLDEVWDCLKGAAGFGTAGILGIAGLQKLASEGIQAVVINVSTWLAKRAGWIGVGLMLLDFGSCIYKEALD